MGTVLDQFSVLGTDLAHMTPRVLGAIGILLLGLLLAWLLDRAVAMACNRVGLDSSSGGQRIAQLGRLAGATASPSMTLRRLTRWSVVLVGFAQAALVLQLEAVSSAIDKVVRFAPLLVIFPVLLYPGTTVADRLARAAHTVAERNGTGHGPFVAAIVRVSVPIAVVVIVLEAAGVAADLPVIVVAFCLTSALGLVVGGLFIGGAACLRTCWRQNTSRDITLRARWSTSALNGHRFDQLDLWPRLSPPATALTIPRPTAFSCGKPSG